jgi:hypothetical protein
VLLACFASVSFVGAAGAHDFERTAVVLTFARDGSFVLDVTNDAAWLEHRLVPFVDRDPPNLRADAGVALRVIGDRVVLFVDGHEIRPESAERIAAEPPLTTWRLRGRVPLDARTLRWYYGLPIDPYPLTIRLADGRIVAHEIAGDAWSAPIDLTGQFTAPRITATTAIAAIAALLLLPIVLRLRRT